MEGEERTIKEEGVEMKNPTGKTLVRNIESTQSSEEVRTERQRRKIGETNPAILLCILFLFPSNPVLMESGSVIFSI